MTNGAAKPGFGAAHYHVLIIGAALAVMSVQLVSPGYYYSIAEHAPMPSRYVPQFVESFRQGIMYPRWMAESFNGYGFPCFIFYPPLYYFLASALYIIGLGIPAANSVLNTIGLYTGGVFLFLFLRGRHGDAAAFAAAMVYMLLPNKLVDLYVNNTPSGRFGQTWMPALLYFTDRLLASPFRLRHLAGMSFSYGALIMSHIATAYMFTPFIAAYWLWGAEKRDLRGLLRLLLGLAVGMCLASVYFVPVLFERGLVDIELLSRQEDLLYWRNFLFGFSDAGRVEGIRSMLGRIRFFTVIETCAAAIACYIAWRFAGHRPGRQEKFIAGATAVCLFMASSSSALLWGNLPGLSTIAFPSRFLSVYMVFLPALAGIAIGASSGWAKKRAGVSILAVVLASIFLLYDGMLIAKASPFPEPDAVRLASTRNLQMEMLPKTVDKDFLDRLNQDDPPLTSTEDFSARVDKWGYIDREFSVDSPCGARLRVKTFWFPGWKAWVDGMETPIGVEEGSGAMLIDIPPGVHEVSLRFTNTPPRTAGWIISLATLVLLCLPWQAISSRRKRHG